MILGWSDSQFLFPGFVSCPGLLSNHSGVEFHAYSDFPLHVCVHLAILFDENLRVCASPGALALHAQIILDYFDISIMNYTLLD